MKRSHQVAGVVAAVGAVAGYALLSRNLRNRALAEGADAGSGPDASELDDTAAQSGSGAKRASSVGPSSSGASASGASASGASASAASASGASASRGGASLVDSATALAAFKAAEQLMTASNLCHLDEKATGSGLLWRLLRAWKEGRASSSEDESASKSRHSASPADTRAPLKGTPAVEQTGVVASARTRKAAAQTDEAPVAQQKGKASELMEESEPGMPWLRWLLLGLTAGAGLLFFFDRRRGSERRQKARTWMTGVLAQAREGFLEGLERVTHRTASGFEAYDPNGPDLDSNDSGQSWMPDRLLKSHITQALNGILEQPRDVQVRVKRGFVRVSGRVPTALKDEVVLAVASVPGVVEVENRLEEV